MSEIFAVSDEDVFFTELLKPGMTEQNARLYIRHRLSTMLIHSGKEGTGIFEAVGIPGEDAAPAFTAGIA